MQKFYQPNLEASLRYRQVEGGYEAIAMARIPKTAIELPLTHEQQRALAAWQAGQGDPSEQPPMRRRGTLAGGLQPAKGARR